MTLKGEDKEGPHQPGAVLVVQVGEQVWPLDIKHIGMTQKTESGMAIVHNKHMREVEASMRVTPCLPNSQITKEP